ncbi:MAG: hypothetical protein JWN86_673 [Planctomycetota bacterium]|nr:hypothetical protein [Planctomycetota bacterium]
MWRGATRRLGLAIALGACCGCGTTKTTGTARTGTEQLLLTNAWDDALRKVDFRPLAGVPVFLDTANVTAVDQGWVVSSLRQTMLSQGVLLKSKAEQAQWVVEARVGAYGTDEYNWLIGVQQTTIPTVVPGIPGGTIPEIPVVKKSDQWAVAKMALFAYDRSSGQMVWNSGTMLSTASAKDVYIGGIGPIQSGSIRKRNKRIGVNIPMLSDPEPLNAPGIVGRGGKVGMDLAPSFAPPTMGLPGSASDLGSFAP